MHADPKSLAAFGQGDARRLKAEGNGIVERKKHIGVDSFFAEKKRILDAYDRAKDQARDDAVKTEHGFVAEDLIREGKWGTFLTC